MPGGDDGDDIWDAYSVPTKNMPGYDEHNHWIGFPSKIEQEEEKYGRADDKPKVGRKPEPNWSFKQKGRGLKKIGNGRKPEPNWSFKQNRNEPFGKQRKPEPTLHKRKPEPKLLRDNSRDIERITGSNRNKQQHSKRGYDYSNYDDSRFEEIDNSYEGSENFDVDDISYVRPRAPVISRKPEPNLLRDTSRDTARLSWNKGSDKKNPFISQKKGMPLVSNSKRIGKLVSDQRSEDYNVHIKRRLCMKKK